MILAFPSSERTSSAALPLLLKCQVPTSTAAPFSPKTPIPDSVKLIVAVPPLNVEFSVT